MPDAPTPAPEPASNGKAKRAKAGFISQSLVDAIDLADDCHLEAAKPEVAAKLAERDWSAADQTKLGEHLVKADDLQNDIAEARAGKGTRTQEESEAREKLLTALDPILKGARRTFASDDAQRAAFGIGHNLSNAITGEVLRHAEYARDQLTGTPPKIVLKGVIATEITAIATLADKYKNADWAQAQAQQTASALLQDLRTLVETKINPARRELQLTADMAYPHRVETNAAQRKAFGLQVDRPLA
ncbi:MAG: hypothetical protein ACKVY0_24805 [Prosthecobacter sp.]|uniref:hypothetical protein n=1 Tax=Prosthecobacter sp. TaxID=1965333 RepID=UPI0038FD8097